MCDKSTEKICILTRKAYYFLWQRLILCIFAAKIRQRQDAAFYEQDAA